MRDQEALARVKDLNNKADLDDPRLTNTRSSTAHNLRPAAALYENFHRADTAYATVAPLASGRLSLTAIWLPAGVTITSITFISSAAVAGPTNQWFALYDANRNLLRQTVDDTTAAWAGTTPKTLALTLPYETPAAGIYYLGIMVAATTPPTLLGLSTSFAVVGLTPKINGNSNTGLTTTAPNPANAIGESGTRPYAYVA